MRRTVKIDPFFSDQPKAKFIDDLKTPVHARPSPAFTEHAPGEDEVSARGAYIENMFPGSDEALKTSLDDFAAFAKVNRIEGGKYPITLRKADTGVYESYRIESDETGATITAGDLDGVRRALIYIEDEMCRREGAFLPRETIYRWPHIRTRITRCFFSPINRPPKYGDELSDDIDYYPEEYLNRLMHDGVNGVWIYTRFSDLVTSEYIKEYGQGGEARMAKLNRTIEKCARYGIKVYVFAIEPVALAGELSEKYPEVDGGPVWGDQHLFCVNTELGRRHVYEAGRKLFTQAPGLGGYISITYGERATSCTSAYLVDPFSGETTPIACPRCKHKPVGEALSDVVKVLCDGIHSVSPDAEVISWTYGHRQWPFDDIRDYVRSAPDDAMLMQNFDDMGYAEQLGEMRQGVDYWLSYPGSSELFDITAEQARESGKHMYAKMQVCCSHEVATVPYVPVPGMLYDKYKVAHRYGVEGVMQCWYFGNYPSLMNKAACELAFNHSFDDKDAFLHDMAAIYWGRSRAQNVVDAWNEFEAGYVQYPLNVMFSYYGPMHDGPVWQLQLEPKNFSLSRTWQTLDPADGDRIGEAMLCGHTLEEVIELTGRMVKHWNAGMDALNAAADERAELPDEQMHVARAIQVMFTSGHAILRFYELRDALGRGEVDATACLDEMERIVRDEIVRSGELSRLCELDGRLGYHSEGEGYKYFPKKLAHRAEQLKTLLATEFVAVRSRVRSSLPPLEYYEGHEDEIGKYKMTRGSIGDARWEGVEQGARFRAAYDPEYLFIELECGGARPVRLSPEFRLMWPDAEVTIHPDGQVKLDLGAFFYYSIFGEKAEREIGKWHVEALPGPGTHLIVKLRRADIRWTQDRPMKLRIEFLPGILWQYEDDPVRTLGKGSLSPGEFGWLLP